MSKGMLAFLCDQQKGKCAQGLWSSHREATDPQSRGCFPVEADSRPSIAFQAVANGPASEQDSDGLESQAWHRECSVRLADGMAKT